MIQSTRRVFMGAIPGMIAGSLVAQSPNNRSASQLKARPPPASMKTAPGLHKLGLRADRDALLYIPESADRFEKAPLVLSLHGATRNADRGIEMLRSLADEH